MDNDSIGDGLHTGEGGAILAKQTWKEKIFPVGAQIKLTRHDLSEICFAAHLATTHIVDKLHKFALANGIPDLALDKISEASKDAPLLPTASQNLDRDD